MTVTQNIMDETALLQEIEALKKENARLKQCKRYGLVWEDHPEALDKKNVIPLLAKDDGLSLPVIADKKQNYLIEGDNYHALKALQHTHRGAIDVIYIDPPYNTGNEFVYNDKIVDKEDSFRHSKWLSFMEKRLKLARELMSDDGVIFISIDDNEQAQLKLLCDAVFGEANFVANIAVHSNPGGNKAKILECTKQYILTYASNVEKLKPLGYMVKVDTNKYKLTDGVGAYKKGNQLEKWGNDSTVKTHPRLAYSIYFNPSTQDVKVLFDYNYDDYVSNRGNNFKYNIPDSKLISEGYVCIRPRKTNSGEFGRWRLEAKTFLNRLRDDGFIFESQKHGYKIYEKDRAVDNKFNKMKDFIDSDTGLQRNELYEIFNNIPFDYPKPISLIKHIVSSHISKTATILDFFAGSGTTGHAVMEINKEDGGDRNFILCTNNEVSAEQVRSHFYNSGHIKKNNKTEFNKFVKEHPDAHQAFLNSEAYESLGIARAVTRERIKRVIEGYTTPKGKDVEGLPNNLTYLKTQEFDKKEQYGFDRNVLAELAFNSHTLKYPELNYESFQVDAFTDIDAIKPTTSKQSVAFVNTRDRESLADIVEQLTGRFGNKVIIETLESYFN